MPEREFESLAISTSKTFVASSVTQQKCQRWCSCRNNPSVIRENNNQHLTLFENRIEFCRDDVWEELLWSKMKSIKGGWVAELENKKKLLYVPLC
jgi:hypothetical protein